MSHRLPCYLHKLRKQWGLSQLDLARLLNITGSALSRFELRSRQPSAELMVAAEVLFGHPAKEVFPSFYRQIEREIVRRAQKEQQCIVMPSGTEVCGKWRFLEEIIERASQSELEL